MAGWLFIFLLSLASAKPLDASKGIQTKASWLLLMDLNSQSSPRFGDYFGSYNSLILSVVWLHKILKTKSFH